MGSLKNMTYCSFVISIVTGPCYHLFGYNLSALLLIIIVFFMKKRTIKKAAFMSLILFIIFMLAKSFIIENYIPYSNYFGFKAFLFTVLQTIIIAFLLMIIKDECQFSKSIVKVFLGIFHLSIIISTIILNIHGKNLYRIKSSIGGIWLAPQNFIIISIFMGMFLTYCILNNRHHRLKRFISLILNLFYLISASYTTQLLFFIFGIILVVFFTYIKKFSYQVIVISVIITLSFIFKNYLSMILNFINETFFSNNTSIYSRINEIIYLISANDMSGSDFSARSNLILISFNTFKNNPIFGVKFDNYNSLSGLTIGSHSQWTDDIARFGIIGSLLWIFLLINCIKSILSCAPTWTSLKKAMLTIFIIYGYFNPIISGSFLMLIFIFINMEAFEIKNNLGGIKNE